MERRERERVVGYAFPPQQLVYTDKDVILYAHGIGATEPWYLYEHYRHGGGGEEGDDKERAFAAFPTFALALPFLGSTGHRGVLPFPPPGMAMVPPALASVEGVDPSAVLHGESAIWWHRPLGVGATERPFSCRCESRVTKFEPKMVF